jgi:hypothetical protein
MEYFLAPIVIAVLWKWVGPVFGLLAAGLFAYLLFTNPGFIGLLR